jgi:hypothetical protein
VTESDVISAARRALGRQLADFRRVARCNQHQLASLVSYARSTVANVEVGRQNAPRKFWERCDQVLSAGGALVRSHDELADLRRQERLEDARAARIDLGADIDLLGLLNGKASAELPLPAGVASVGAVGFAGMSLHESAQHLLKLFLHLDDEMGGDALFLPLSRFVGRLARSVGDEPDLGLGELGELSQMTGWLALDAGRHGSPALLQHGGVRRPRG